MGKKPVDKHMNPSKYWKEWRTDRPLQKIIKNSGYLFGSSILGFFITILATRMLGAFDYGVLTIVFVFTSSVNRLFSFRMGELVVKYVSQYLINNETERAAVVLKMAYLVEMTTSIVAFILVVLLSPLAAEYLGKDVSLTPLFVVYGVLLLTNLVYETSLGLLHAKDKFPAQAWLNLLQNVLIFGVVLYGSLTQGSIWVIMTAYLVGKSVNSLAIIYLALRQANQDLGKDWWRVSIRELENPREFWRFALSTNFSATVNQVSRDSDELFISYFLSPLEVGYYSLARKFINYMLIPINPFISTTYPEISRRVGQKLWGELRSLLKKVTLISGAWTGTVVLGLLVLGNWLVSFLYGPEFLPALPILLVLLAGYGLANVFYWNRPILLALGEAVFPLKIAALAGLAKIILTIFYVPIYGYMFQAGLMSAFLLITVGLNLVKSQRLIKTREILETTGA